MEDEEEVNDADFNMDADTDEPLIPDDMNDEGLDDPGEDGYH